MCFLFSCRGCGGTSRRAHPCGNKKERRVMAGDRRFFLFAAGEVVRSGLRIDFEKPFLIGDPRDHLFRRRYSVGVIPVCSRNTREKWEADVKPARKATIWML